MNGNGITDPDIAKLMEIQRSIEKRVEFIEAKLGIIRAPKEEDKDA